MPKKNEEVDYSALLETDVPRLKEEAKKNLSGALEGLFLLEKQTRQGGDFTTCAKIAREIVRICYQSENWTQLNDTLVTLSKRRGQSKTVIQEAVQEAMGFLDSIDEIPVATELIKILRGITEGKIFVELESAELTKKLAEIYEKTDKIKQAAKVLQEVQVETLSKMETKEKINYILEQVRLCLRSNDFIRAQILSRKVNQKILAKDEFQQEKLRYHQLMIEFYGSQENCSEIARAYQSIFNTPMVQENEEEWSKNLKLLCIFSVLSAHSSEQSDMINRTFLLKKLSELPLYRQLLKQFLTKELMNWSEIEAHYSGELSSFPQFSGESGEKLWKILQLRVVEHNIRVIAEYYSRIKSDRLCQLLGLEQSIVEERLSDLVVNGSIYARIDRPAGLINFRRPSSPVDTLNDWKGNVNELLNLIEKTCHLVQRENMVYQHAKVRGGK
mmetsp:Transcript_133260/g.198231  ORF Transcript_133260/g.198231 Transcript_133260/m.198231 type:complete len:444 (+) Transcript_133260:24-1355(+)|eukprot:CAMPEP_0117034876 /NCGR_PEP_ID=MMETSP0472-20121206/24799_1 /TAXON_ID=693140 ORGANISM="Tiarina fusus, Strain LIS" /NCGR_SAMPLE_ID=MMETSP0472 /ASSEMBLY_ACC=CAM_ASM_000603 /LENGTH=443 /DNA_ID=CAMNT_0004744169 /DNA_START=24 /DNA_END=1355 /DNA_ORIENTATION=+